MQITRQSAAKVAITLLLGLLVMPATAGEIMTTSNTGIQCFNEQKVDYRRPGKPSVKVHFGAPVTVAVSPKPEGWGPYQFPNLVRWDDGTLHITFSISEDSVTGYGKPSGSMVSRDGGKSWVPQGEEQGVYGLPLPNGDRIVITTPKAYKVEDIKLPAPAGTITDTYGGAAMTVYRLQNLPAELQTVRLNRVPKGSKEWIPEQAKLIDPQALRYSLIGLFPIVWWGDVRIAGDGSVIAGIYPGLRVRDDGSVDPKGGVFFYRSTDSGHTWTIQGRIPYQPDSEADSKADKRNGFTEPAFDILADGSLICIMRTSDGVGIGPMYSSRSTDLGKTWSKPVVIAGNGVLPKLLRLENGVMVLASGRPGVQVRFSTDGKCEQWTDPFEIVDDTCGYTSLLATGPDSFIIAYSDFKYSIGNGETRKAIKIREVRVSRS